MSSEELPFPLRGSVSRKYIFAGATLSTAIAVVIAVAEATNSYLWIAIGSALGGMARHWCNAVAMELLGASFPWGTLFINVVGSFVIGFFFALTSPSGRFDVPVNAKLFVMTGICGGYTTFSAFSLQSLSLFQEGEWVRGGGYIAASVMFCLLAVWIGYALGAAINWAFR
jgi:fluoride exporter